MTLEEAIKAEEAETLAYEECLNSLDDNMPTDMWNELNKSLGKQMDYHRQLAEWLRELKEYRKFYTCYNCYNSSASFNEYPCNVCRRGREATKNIKDHYEEVNADDTNRCEN